MDPFYFTKHGATQLMERSLRLLRPTWKTSLLFSVAVHLPLAVLSALFLPVYLDGFMAAMRGYPDVDIGAMLSALGPSLGLGIIYLLVYGVLSAVLTGLVSRNGYLIAKQEPRPAGYLAGEVLGQRFGAIMAFAVLESLILLGGGLVLAALYFLSIFLPVLAGIPAQAMAGFIAAASVIVYLIALAAFGCLYVVFQVGVPAIVNEGMGPGRALGACFRLVRGRFMRSAGATALFHIVLAFAISLLTMPLQFLVSASAYNETLQGILAGGSVEQTTLLAGLIQALRDMAVPMAISGAASGILSSLAAPLFETLLYLDLGIRAGTIPDAALTPPAAQGTQDA